MTQNTFYLDMDGVVADWQLAASNFLGRPLDHYVSAHYKNTPEEWLKIRAESRFYRHLPLMQGAVQLVQTARQYRDQLGWNLRFLTAVPRKDDMPWAFYDKVLWALDHFPDIPVHFGPHSVDKWRHCQPGDILVDDRLDNCTAWGTAGGRAIRVENNSLAPALQEVQRDLAIRLRRQ
jgi:5'(3')-deoxyribonucleotidase